jgi:predicted transcriptional regulator
VKTPWQCLRGAVQGSAEAPGRFAAAFSAWSEVTVLRAVEATARWFGLRASAPRWPGSRPKAASKTLYAFAADGASRQANEVPSSVDTAVEAPYAGSMNLQVPPELEAKLTRLAAETGRTVDQVALDLLATSMDHDDWFRAEVEKGRAAAREGRLIEHDDVAARMDRRYRG